MYRYFISIILIFSVGTVFSQDDPVVTDSTFAQKYGLRVGGDISKLVRTLVDEDYSGFEVNGDYRLTQNLYVAGEIGVEERTLETDFLNTTTQGSFFKAGVDYNMYKNWFGMENMIYAGGRIGVSSFKHTINSYTIFNTDQTFPQPTITEGQEIKGLSAIWAELIIGIKAETLNNLYMGLNVQFKGLITEKEPDNFENVYIPGFNRTFDSGGFGVGFGYNISYLIPIYKKDK